MNSLPVPDNAAVSRRGRVVDVSRIISRIHRRTPTGIDRVEFAFARHYLETLADRDLRFVVSTPVNSGLVSRPLSRHIIRTAVERWTKSDDEPAAAVAFDQLSAALKTPMVPRDRPIAINVEEPPPDMFEAASMMKMSAYVEATINGLANPGLADTQLPPAWYMHVSHMNLQEPQRFEWLKRTQLKRMFMVQDLIPISHPEFFMPGEADKHGTRMEAIARLADQVIFISKTTQAAWNAYLESRNLPLPKGRAVPLGTEDLFLNGADGPKIQTEVPYFVVTGTLESRKNISFLLHIWRQWVEQSDVPRARMVIVGRRGRHSENAVDLLERSPKLASSVIEVAALSDTGLATLLRGARALLAPSFIEGFGLPVAEALSLRVPVIASSIESHQEVAGRFADYVDPLDGTGWLKLIDEYAKPDSARWQKKQAETLGYRASSWADHFAAVEAILGENTD